MRSFGVWAALGFGFVPNLVNAADLPSKRILSFAPSSSSAISNLSSLYVFGDSLSDEGRAGRTAAVMWPEVFRNDTTITQGQNYAIGGATTSNQPSARFGDSSFLGQVNTFVTSGTGVPANAAAGIWIGTNNIWIQTGQGAPPARIAASATADVATGIKTLAGAGVRNVLLLGVYDLSLTNAFQLAGVDTMNVRMAAASASQRYNAQLASLTVPGASIQYFSIANFINHLQTNPGAYGFQQILPLQAGATCNAACQQTSIFTDTIHLTSKTQTLIGDYIASGDPLYNSANFTYGAIAANYASTVASAALPAELARSAANRVVTTLFDRLDASRDLPTHGSEGRSAASGVGAPNPWSVFSVGGVSDMVLPRRGGTVDYTSDVDTSAAGITTGIGYDAGQGLRLGAVFDYGHADADLMSTIGSKTRIDAYQGGFYASLSQANWFVDSIATGGTAHTAQTRSGLFGTVTSSPNGGVATASSRGGYLFEAGPVRVGPVLGLSYSRTWFDAYTEQGDALAVMTYGRQISSGLDGSAGIEMKLADPARCPIHPIIGVTYEHAFLAQGQPIPVAFAYLPTQTLPASVDADQDAVKIALGTAFDFGHGFGGTVSAFGLRGLHDFSQAGFSGGMAYQF